MRKRTRAIIAGFLIALSQLAIAQEITRDDEAEHDVSEMVLYSRQSSFKVTAGTQGFGFGFSFGRIKNIEHTNIWDFDAVSLTSLKQIKLVNTYFYNARPYVYGKLNHVFVIRGGYGREKRLFAKPYWGGVELRLKYVAGVSLALQKPYYYYVFLAGTNTNEPSFDDLATRKFDDHENWAGIFGRAPFFEGITETTLAPGIHAKIGLNFDIGKSKTILQAVEIGAIIEGFLPGVSIMEDQRNKKLLCTLYIAYSFGSRFNKY